MLMEIIDEIVQQSIAKNEPKWLTEKRKLAVLMMDQWPVTDDEQRMIDQWLAHYADYLKCDGYSENRCVGDVVDMDILEAVHEYPELLQENLMEKAISWQESQLAAWHLALLNGGRFIYIPKGTVVKEPLRIELNAEQNEHALVIVGADVQVDLIERVAATAADTNYVGTEILLGTNAKVNFYQANELSATTNHQEVKVYQAQDSELKIYAALFEEESCKTVFESELNGAGSKAVINMVAMADGNQLQNVQTKINNIAPNTDAQIIQHGVAKDSARLILHAVGKIIHGAHQSGSQQTSRLLTLSSESSGEADPVLLIEENDVSAGHAASIGKVDEDQLYYMQTRGITKQQAQYLLTRGFLDPVLQQFPNEDLKQAISERLEHRLGTKVGMA